MTETLADRATIWADAVERNGRPGLAELLRLLVAANATLATERNAALAAVTTAEQRAVNAEAQAEALAAEARAQEREACAAIADAHHESAKRAAVEEWGYSNSAATRARIEARAYEALRIAVAIRARKDSTP